MIFSIRVALWTVGDSTAVCHLLSAACTDLSMLYFAVFSCSSVVLTSPQGFFQPGGDKQDLNYTLHFWEQTEVAGDAADA